MNSAHRRTLAAIFSKPTPKSLEWAKVEALLVVCGCEKYEGAGSRVSFAKGGVKMDAHRPHPGKETKPYQVRNAKAFLEQIGVTP